MRLDHDFDDPQAPLVYDFNNFDLMAIAQLKFELQMDAVAEGRPFDGAACGEVDLSDVFSAEELRKWFEDHDDEFREKAERQYIEDWERDRRASIAG